METSMANTKEIQKRMKSIKDTMKITNAMYMVSSSKLQKARKRHKDTEFRHLILLTRKQQFMFCY